MTWHRPDDSIVIFNPCVRYGVEGGITDVMYIDGEEITYSVKVDVETGIVQGDWSSFKGKEEGDHPLKGVQIPGWKEAVEMVTKGHPRMFFHDLIGWDVTIDNNGTPVCIEYNIKEPGTKLYQFAGGPYAGQFTEELLAFLLDDEKRKQHLPRYFRK